MNDISGTEMKVPARLLRHFMIFNVPSPTPTTLYQTVDTILQVCVQNILITALVFFVLQ